MPSEMVLDRIMDAGDEVTEGLRAVEAGEEEATEAWEKVEAEAEEETAEEVEGDEDMEWGEVKAERRRALRLGPGRSC
jgi:hypothetical protein